MEKKDLLVEIGTEELPPTALKRLSASFSQEILSLLEQQNLNFASSQSFATPRRLALLIKDLDTKQEDKTVQRKGPAVKAAFDKEGNPSKAALGFARSCGVEFEQLEQIETDKGAWLSYTTSEKGKETKEILPEIIKTSLDRLPIPKRMRWGALEAQFVRPVHWAVLLLGDEIIETEILSVTSSNTTYGHRFHAPEAISLNNPADYEKLLLDTGLVIASFEKRQELIRQQIEECAKEQNAIAIIDEDLLDEVTAMIERPQVVLGNFDAEFLDVPAEALISAMKKHQKYFHLTDENNQLLPAFITISNIHSQDIDQVKKGNERVIRPRLADAGFFWKQDLKISPEQRVESLKTVVFQNKLGTLYEKTQRVSQLAEYLAEQLAVDKAQSARAALLAKTDLMSEMINEFPDLQGIMGKYYAEKFNEDQNVAIALDEQYLPRFSGDKVASNPIGQVLAISERLDTLIGIFAIGLIPSGDKDPFALRRATLGLIRTIIENDLKLDLEKALQYAANLYPCDINPDQAVTTVLNFIRDRLKTYVLDKGFTSDVFDSVAELFPLEPLDFMQRVAAVSEFKTLNEAENLSAANKRIGNILKKNPEDVNDLVDEGLLSEAAEKELFANLKSIKETANSHFQNKEYTDLLKSLAVLKDPIDAFFDDVMVMADDPKVKANRIGLINQVRSLFIQVADLSYLQK